MRSLTSWTRPSRTRTSIAPSPSTRASILVRISRSAMVRLALGPERRRAGVERAIQAHDVALGQVVTGQPAPERARIGLLHRPETAVAAAVVARAQRTAAGVRHRAQARRAVSDHHADVAAALALDAHAVTGDLGPALVQIGADDLEQLALVGRAAVELEVDGHVLDGGRRVAQRGDVLRAGVDGRHEFVDVGEVAQGLDAAGRGACADGDEPARAGADLADARGLLGGRHRPLDARQVVLTLDPFEAGLREIGDVELAAEREQLVLAVQERQLAAVA